MRKRSCTALVVASLVGFCARAGAGYSKPAAATADQFAGQVDAAVPSLLARYHVPGAAVGLIDQGTIRWVRCYGLADEARNIAVSSDTVFRAASISKPVTAWGVMRLAEEGRLDLDAPVERYLHRWHLPSSQFDSSEVTMRRLLSHTAGLTEPGSLGIGLSLVEALNTAAGPKGSLRIARRPGSAFLYSNVGYTVAQLVVEEVVAESFAEYMQREVLVPLGMTRSSFVWTADLDRHVATGYRRSGEPVPNYSFADEAAGGLYTTVSDLAGFVAANMPGPHGQPAGRGVLRPDSVAQLFSPAPGTNGAYGLGFQTEGLPAGVRMVSHFGKIPGWSSGIAFLPDRGQGLVVLTNGDLGFLLVANVLCAWTQCETGTMPVTPCQMVQSLGPVTILIAVLLGLGLAGYGWRQAHVLRTRQRRFAFKSLWTRPAWKVARVSVALLAGALWSAVWYTDLVPREITGVGGFTPAALMPPTFVWVTVGIVLWCLVIVATVFISDTQTAATRRSAAS
jgi:CubicO group peptidase (beta-lactamase class C family)